MKKIVLRILWICLGLFFAAALFIGTANIYVLSRASAFIASPDDLEESADCIIILGAGVHGTTLSQALRARMDTGIALYQSGAGKKLLLSGDHGSKNYDEVNAMKAYALQAGVPAEDIFMDHAGFSTYDSLYRAREVFQVASAVVVTQDFHIARAVYHARSFGIDAVGVVAQGDYQTRLTDHVRELFARANAFVATEITKPQPAYLGDAIPIFGNGLVTQD